MLATLGETYKVQMLTGYKPTALELFRMATRGNAERLRLDHEIGALETGKFADIVVLDPQGHAGSGGAAGAVAIAGRHAFRADDIGR